MSDFSVRSDSVDVEQIMRQIRSRIREKRGVDYTENEIRELANVKLEKFLDPGGVRSDLLEQYRKGRDSSSKPRNYAFEDTTLYDSSRGFIVWIRKLLQPILKLFFNPNPLIEALHIQSKLNDSYNHSEALYYELIHNLVLETTRLGIEVKNLKMRVESMSSRLDFDERRARALEGVVQYRPGAVPPLQPPAGRSVGRRCTGERRRAGGTPCETATAPGPAAPRSTWRLPDAKRRAAPPTRRRTGKRVTANEAAYEPADSREPADRGAERTERVVKLARRRSALRRRHQRRGGAARPLHRRAAVAARRGRGPHDLRARLHHLA